MKNTNRYRMDQAHSSKKWSYRYRYTYIYTYIFNFTNTFPKNDCLHVCYLKKT